MLLNNTLKDITHLLLKSYISRAALVFIGTFFGLLNHFYIMYSINLDGYGEIAKIIMITYIISVIGEFGINLYANDLLKKNEYQKNGIYITRLITLKFSISLLLTFIFIPILIHEYSLKLIIFFFINSLILSLSLIWLFQVFHLQKKLIVSTAVGKVLSFILIFLYLENDLDTTEQVIKFLLIGNLVFICMSYYVFFKSNFKLSFNFRFSILLEDIKNSFRYFLINFTQNYNHTYWSLLLILIAENTIIGIYNICDIVIRLYASFTNFIPDILHNFKNRFKNFRFFLVYMNLLFIFLILSLAGWFIFKVLISKYLNGTYHEAIYYLPIAILIGYVSIINKLIVVPIILKKYSLSICFYLNLFISLFYLAVVLILYFALKDSLTIHFLLNTILGSSILILLILLLFIYKFELILKKLKLYK